MVLLAILSCFATSAPAQDVPASQPAAPVSSSQSAPATESFDQRVSYSIGQELGGQFRSQGIAVDLAQLMQGIADAISGAESRLSAGEIQSTMIKFQEQMVAKQKKAQAAQGEANRAEAKIFFANNGARDGVKTTASGLQYEVITEGEGPKPSATDRVSVHYEGTLINGTVFDSSIRRGQPAALGLNQVIPGWTEGVQLMPVGSKYRFFIPGELAYGKQGSPPVIGPDATLIFEIELLEIQK